MLFRKVQLQGIKSGQITLTFRRWKKAAVKSGSLLHTAIGLVEIHQIEPIDEKDITHEDALKAGFEDKKQLINAFTHNQTGIIFKISLSYHSADPRIKLREQTGLSEFQFSELKKKVERLDKFSKRGDWTASVLKAIKENPNLHAVGIAKLTGFEKDWLKLNIRKLKNLGLTISHKVGYELSPLGKEYLKRLGGNQ